MSQNGPTREVRFLVTSDLHYGHNPEGDRAVEALARYVAQSDADVLLLGGDLATGPTALHACLALFEGFRGARLAVPGNHDVWLRPDAPGDSWQRHEEALPRMFAEHGVHALHLGPFFAGELAFVGSMGWYDYSFRDDIGIDLVWYRRKTLPGMLIPVWNDARYARFPFSDEQLTARLVERLGEQLAAVASAPRVVALVHHLCTRQLLVHPRELVPRHWRFLNAFLGSERFAELFNRTPAVTQVFCGHSHMARTAKQPGRTFTSVGSTYRRKQLLVATAGGLLERLDFGAASD